MVSDRASIQRMILAILSGGILTLSGCNLQSYLRQLPQAQRSSPGEPHASETPVQSPQTQNIEAEVWQQINQVRQQQGLSALKNNEKLATVARRYSRRMAEGSFFSHTSPAGDTVVERVRSAGIWYWVVGENLFRGTNVPRPAASAVQGWMNSPGHRHNILYPDYRETGIGVWRVGNTYYITQLFLRSV